ncbi:MAG TPA: hypothetical protein VNJ01_12315 [Bacteriovoracaceae bacterium]|nr:hypothetical protein [Bacteriovoracaceae bacterium]
MATKKADKTLINKLLRLATDERHITAQAVTSLSYVSTEYTKLDAEQIEKFSPAWCENIKLSISILTQALSVCEGLRAQHGKGEE